MKPVISKINMTVLATSQRRKVCECEKLCDQAILISTYNDGIMVCWNDARQTMYDMINTLDEYARTTWNDEDEQFLIKYYENGAYYGINSELSDKLGKTYRQVKSKVSQLRQKGLIAKG